MKKTKKKKNLLKKVMNNKILIISLCIVILIAALFIYKSKTTEYYNDAGVRTKGDVNGDYKVSSVDYIYIKKYILNTITLSEEQKKYADVNSDSSINSLDYIYIRKIILGLMSIPTDPTTVPTTVPTTAPSSTPAPTIAPTVAPTSPPAPTVAPTSPPSYTGSQPIVPESSIRRYEGSTLKYYIQYNNGYYLTYIWMKDPYSQIKKLEATTAQYGRVMTDDQLASNGYSPLTLTVGEMMKKYVSNDMIPTGKAAVGFNASAFFVNDAWTAPPTSYYNRRSDSWLVINDGVVTRKIMDDYDKWKNNYRVIIGITSGGDLGIYGVGSTLAEREQIVNAVSRDGVLNTFSFRGPVLIGPQAWKNNDSAAQRQAICQIDSNNYVMVTTVYNYTTDQIVNILNNSKGGCSVAFNLDGGGSTSLYSKYPNQDPEQIYVAQGTSGRSIVEGIYFTE